MNFFMMQLPDLLYNQIILFLLDEQEIVQKRTFTKWINSHLAKVKKTPRVLCLFSLSQ